MYGGGSHFHQGSMMANNGGMAPPHPDPMQGSIVLEEEIDENYEPTQDEIIEYAKFLGIDLIDDRDLVYIAKEGLKAPLPHPWKPCQTRDGEIYYYNFDNGESTWEHPCDEYYKSMYLKEKEKKIMKQNEKIRKSKDHPSYAARQQVQEFMSQPAEKKKELPTILPKTDIFNKSNDILIKTQNDKKLKEYRDQKEEELAHRKLELDKIYQDKFEELEDKFKQDQVELQQQRKEQEQEQQDDIEREIEYTQNHLDQEIEDDLKDFEQQQEEKIQKQLDKKLETQKKSKEQGLVDFKEKMRKEAENLIKRMKIDEKRKFDQKIKALEREEREIQEIQNLSEDEELGEDQQLEEYKRKFVKEQQEQFEQQKLEIKKENSQNLNNFKIDQTNLFQSQMEFIGNDQVGEFDEYDFEQKLTSEKEQQLKSYEQDQIRIVDEKKREIDEKMDQQKKRKEEDIKIAIESEVSQIQARFEKEKETKEQEFEIFKSQIDAKQLDEFISYKNEKESAFLEEDKKLRSLFQNKSRIEQEKESVSKEVLDKLEMDMKIINTQNQKLKQELNKIQTDIINIKTEIDLKKQNQIDNESYHEDLHKDKDIENQIQKNQLTLEQLKKDINDLNSDVDSEPSDIDEQEILQKSQIMFNMNKQKSQLFTQSDNQFYQKQIQYDQINTDINKIKKLMGGNQQKSIQNENKMNEQLKQVLGQIKLEKRSLIEQKTIINQDVQGVRKNLGLNQSSTYEQGIMDEKIRKLEERKSHLHKVEKWVMNMLKSMEQNSFYIQNL